MSNVSHRASADYVVRHATLITMDARRRVINDGAMAVSEGKILWVGRDAELPAPWNSWTEINYSGRVVSPGFLNGHVHVTGDPLTRHYMPDNLSDADRLHTWVLPRYFAHDPMDEQVSATFCALELLKSGTTTFIEAGTIRHLDAAVAGLGATGIRARVGTWVEGENFGDPNQSTALTDAAIRTLEDQNSRYPDSNGELIAAWPILVGHNTNPDAVWQAAKQIADQNGQRLAAHMSPYSTDADWYLANKGRRPIEHLNHLDVLGSNVMLTHAAHLDANEAAIMAETGTNIVFCPFASLKGAFGIAAHGRYIDMMRAGVGLILATDGYDCDILTVTRLATAMFKDLAEDIGFGSALRGIEMITCEAAKVVGLDDRIGSLEPGKRADFLSFDADHFQWRPLLSPLDGLHWTADARSLRDVWVDGVKVIEDGHSTFIDEEALLRDVQARAEKVIARSGLPFVRTWEPVA